MSALFHSPAGGDAQRVQAGQVLDLTAPTLADGVPVFRRTLYLRVALDDACDRLSLAAASALGLRFEPCTVEITRGDDAWVRAWTGGPGLVSGGAAGATRVELSYPAPVVRVDSELYGQVALHRVDGDAVSEAPTVSGTTGAALAEPFVASVFQARLSGEKPGVRAWFRNRQITLRQTGHRSLSAAAVGMQHLQGRDSDLLDVDWLVELLGGLTALRVAGAPGSPRLTLRSADGAEVLWQWIEPGPHAGSVTFAATKLADDWQAALERALLLAEQGDAPRPAALVLPLDITSDTPCQVRLQEVAVVPLLERAVLPAPAVLHFGGAAPEVHHIPLETQARTQRLAVQGRIGGAPGAAAALGDAQGPRGVYLESGTSALIAVELPSPLRCTAAAVGWIPLGGPTVIAVQLEAANQARPLAVAEVNSESALAGLLYARWTAVDLQPATYCLRLSVREGCGVLVAAPGAGASVRVMDSAVAREVPLQPQVTLLDADQAPFPAELFLNSAAIAVTGEVGGNFLGSVASPPTAESWTLSAGSSAPLTVTVESVRVSYTPD